MNFQRAFRQLPEAAALGLTDKNFCLGAQSISSSSMSGSNSGSSNVISAVAGSNPSNPALSATGSADPQILLQTFCRFLLQQLQRECDNDHKTGASASASAAVGGSARSGRQSKLQTSTTSASNTIGNTSTSSANSAGVIDDVFGYSVTTTTTFLISGTRETGNPHRSLSSVIFSFAVTLS